MTQNIERRCACFQEKYYKVCIARAAVNESVCEDSHTTAHVVCKCSGFYVIVISRLRGMYPV